MKSETHARIQFAKRLARLAETQRKAEDEASKASRKVYQLQTETYRILSALVSAEDYGQSTYTVDQRERDSQVEAYISDPLGALPPADIVVYASLAKRLSTIAGQMATWQRKADSASHKAYMASLEFEKLTGIINVADLADWQLSKPMPPDRIPKGALLTDFTEETDADTQY